jgi:hypothetical protein
MKRSVILFSALALVLSLGIQAGANDLVHLQKEYIGEDNPKNQIWLATDKKRLVANNILCEHNKEGIKVVKYKACAVKYFTSLKDRKPYELKYKRADNKFYLADEKTPYDSARATDQAVADKKYALYKDLTDTRDAQGSLPAIWAMDPTGRLFVCSTPQPGIFNHSSFLGGGSVICAGEIIIIDGKITFINNRSGHYKPPDEALINAIDKLRDQGVKLDPALVLQYMGAKYEQSLKDHDAGAPIGYALPSNLER